ncbi:hypothetical protein [Cohnella nanjingensis]|uniref:Uncharacterized protein n=1 Tax=Cohnella nanjingensis TaxID=1387779 RepID=A0A7X0VEJ1_9BACL|nr:hypothetical protein [Cohnella nanjingensis]MBB6669609.1 hypothetical protein [Cohnella nanjingensis]
MKYAVSETNGTEPAAAWLRERLIAYAKQKYGIDLQVSVNGKYAKKAQSPAPPPVSPR